MVLNGIYYCESWLFDGKDSSGALVKSAVPDWGSCTLIGKARLRWLGLWGSREEIGLAGRVTGGRLLRLVGGSERRYGTRDLLKCHVDASNLARGVS